MSRPNGSRALHVTLWVLQVLLALAYLSFGYSKLAGAQAAVEIFDRVGWGDWFRYLVGVLEIAVAIPLVIPRYARRGAIALIVLALFAIGVHASIGDPRGLVFLVPIAMAAVVVWGRGRRRETPANESSRQPVLVAQQQSPDVNED